MATEEPKQSLPVGHPQAGYVSADLSNTGSASTLSDASADWAKKRDEARKAEADQVADDEDKAVKAEAKAAEDAAKADEPAAPTKAKSSSSSSS